MTPLLQLFADTTAAGTPPAAFIDDVVVVGTGLGALAAGAAAGYSKLIKPRLASIDNAVNHGRVERLEVGVTRITRRTDRLEERLDTHVAQLNDRLHSLDERTREGQKQILDAVNRHETKPT